MTTEEQWQILNQAFGYEVAVLLMTRSMTQSDIQRRMPYDTMHDRQIERILDKGYEANVFEVTGVRGTDEFTLNETIFSQQELDKINLLALSRLHNPAEERGEPMDLESLPAEFFVRMTNDSIENETVPSHTDFAKVESRFDSEFNIPP